MPGVACRDGQLVGQAGCGDPEVVRADEQPVVLQVAVRSSVLPAHLGGAREYQEGRDVLLPAGALFQPGWRLERMYPTPLFEPLRGEERFQQLMGRIDADLERMKARVEREGLAPPLP